MSKEKMRELLDGQAPSSDQVAKIHEKSDKDGGPKSQHHTLGPGPNQASPGNHTHDGGNSAFLLDGYTLTGSRADTATMITKFIEVLKLLGMKDSTTA